MTRASLSQCESASNVFQNDRIVFVKCPEMSGCGPGGQQSSHQENGQEVAACKGSFSDFIFKNGWMSGPHSCGDPGVFSKLASHCPSEDFVEEDVNSFPAFTRDYWVENKQMALGSEGVKGHNG